MEFSSPACGEYGDGYSPNADVKTFQGLEGPFESGPCKIKVSIIFIVKHNCIFLKLLIYNIIGLSASSGRIGK